MRILLIDDDKDDQALFREAVSDIAPDVECSFADNGIAGLRLLQSDRPLPDLLFLDVNMPLMDGRETLRLIRKDPRFQSLSIIMYSTSNSSRDVEWFFQMNTRYIVKPTCFEKLKAILREELMTEQINL